MTAIRRGLLAASVLLGPACAARAAEPISQFHLGPNATVETKLKVQAGKVYPMEISGTRKYVDPRLPDDFQLADAFYCFQSSAKGGCPPATKEPVSSPVIYPQTGPGVVSPMQSFVAGGTPPAYSASHTYTFGYKPTQSGTLFLSTQPKCGSSDCSGEGFDIKIYAPEGPADACATPRRATAAAVNEVRVVAVQPSVDVHKAGTPEDQWCPVTRDTVLQQGDEISCDPDGAVTLQFADNSTVVVRDTTQLKIASFFTEGGVVKTEILLKMGQVAAKVHKSEATRSDFVIKSGGQHAGSVRGTDFSVFYDPGSRTSVFSVREGTVAVTNGSKTSLVGAGKEALLAGSKITVAGLGKAGARNGVTRLTALDRVLKLVARANGPCKVSPPRTNAFAVKPVAGGWGVAVKLTGKHKGTARWTVKGKRTKAVNALAKRVTKRCG